MQGLWWDRTRPGHGFDLRHGPDGWQLTVHTFDVGGAPVWLRAQGEILDARWQDAEAGLLRYRLPQGTREVAIDRLHVQSVAIDFAPSQPAAGACATRGPPTLSGIAFATLAVDGLESTFCLEPLRLRPGGRPRVDIDGVWSAAGPWQLALTTQGMDPDARVSSLLTYFDRDGQPRWAFGAGDWRAGRAELPMLVLRDACPQCAPAPGTVIGQLSLSAVGDCASARVLAGVRMSDAGESSALPRGQFELSPSARIGCY